MEGLSASCISEYSAIVEARDVSDLSLQWQLRSSGGARVSRWGFGIIRLMCNRGASWVQEGARRSSLGRNSNHCAARHSGHIVPSAAPGKGQREGCRRTNTLGCMGQGAASKV